MELTPKAFREVQFREKLRGGYHPEDVDQFLEEAAVATESIMDRLRQASERADRAEKMATEASTIDESLKRVLLLAQRTADQAVKEAYDEAEKIVSEARAKAEAILAEAEEQGQASHEAVIESRRSSLEAADQALAQAQAQVEVLRGWVDLHRNHLLGVIRQSQAIIENASLVSEPPSAGPVTPGWLAQSGQAEGSSGTRTSSRRGQRRDEAAQWDPRYLDDLDKGAGPDHLQHGQGTPGPGDAAAVGGQPGTGAGDADNTVPGLDPSSPAGPSAEATAGAEGAEHGADYHPEHGGPLAAAEGTAPSEGAPNAAASDATLAFDEHALESFFSDKDLGDNRGMGRFRRRQ
jgi:DivIVA domain-containing protein